MEIVRIRYLGNNMVLLSRKKKREDIGKIVIPCPKGKSLEIR